MVKSVQTSYNTNIMETQTVKTTPKDFFLYLLSNIALYYCAGWLVSLLYDFINYSFGSINFYETSWLPGSMRWAIASLVIVFPVYIWVTHRLNKDLEAHPAKREMRVRKWLIYLTLALASIAMVVDLIALVDQFLSGEFVPTFFLKVLAVAVVSALVFFYYYYELRRDAGKPAPSHALFRYIAIALVVLSVGGALFAVGSPETARNRQYDQRRVSDLQQIQSQVVYYYQRKQVLPTEISQLNDPLSGFAVPVDPVTSSAYTYRSTAPMAFELCATFATEATDGQLGDGSMAPRPVAPIMEGGKYFDVTQDYWAHGAGEVCFPRTIDPERYPPLK